MKKINVFYAHKARMDEERMKEEQFILGTVLKPRMERHFGEEVELRITPGGKDFAAYFQGDWNAWAEGVHTRRNSVTGRLLYDLFVCPDQYVGRATAHMLITALGNGRKIFYFDVDTCTLKTVRLIACIDDDNWSSGYQLITRTAKEASND